MQLSVVIPVWNDQAGLDRLLAQIGDLDLFFEVIVVDDASETVMGPQTVPSSAALAEKIIWLRSEAQKGAGHARNMALEHVRGSHVIFFDSDDLFLPGFVDIVGHAASAVALQEEGETPFDFMIFRHDDSRVLDAGGVGSFPAEETRWETIGASQDASEPFLVSLDTDETATLVRISAYPWNKIYRTDFLRDERIRCTEIMVHNDFELHWNSFICAKKILACREAGAIHYVIEDGLRLTNRRGSERLEVFQAFESVLARIFSKPETRIVFLQPLLRFSWDLLGWINGRIDPTHTAELTTRTRRFFYEHLDTQSMTILAYADPALAGHIARFMKYGKRR